MECINRGRGAYFFLNLAFAGNHREMTIEKQISKVINPVILPIINTST